MQMVDHPNVIKLYEIYDEPKKMHLVMELVTGGELFERIVARRRYAERDAAEVLRKLLATVAFLHARHIAHRDLKPENILLRGSDDDTDLVLVDFGIAKSFVSDYAMRTPCGSVHYTAPEVMRAVPYGPKADVWSVGVISYVLLCGYLPFDGESSAADARTFGSSSATSGASSWSRSRTPAALACRAMRSKPASLPA